MYAIPAVMLVWGWGGGRHIRAPPPDSMAQQYQGTWKAHSLKCRIMDATWMHVILP